MEGSSGESHFHIDRFGRDACMHACIDGSELN